MATALSDPLKHDGEGRRLVYALLGLLVLAGTSWGLAHVSLGFFAAPVALLIAALKAVVVLSVFMRLSQGSTAARFALGIAALFICLLALVVATDVLLR